MAHPGEGNKPIETIHEDATVRLQMADGEGEFVLVAFTGVGHAMGGIDVQQPEFLSMCRMGKVLWVSDKARSWGNNLDLDAITDRITDAAAGKPIVAIGNSMGGFLAILFSRALNARKVLAFAPQWSVDPAIVPKEKRWRDYRRNIQTFRFPDLTGAFDDACRYAVIGGDQKLERMHSKLFPDQLNVELVELKKLKHEVAAHLKEAGLLQEVLTGFFHEDRRVRDILSGTSVRLR